MATVPTLTASIPTIAGQDTTFVLAISNTGGSQITLTNAGVTVTQANGALATSVSVSPFVVPNGSAGAFPGTSQFNVAIAASGTYYLPFSAVFAAPAVQVGSSAQPNQQYLVSAQVTTTDGTVSTPQLMVAVNSAQLGGVTYEQPTAAPAVGSLNFSSLLNSGLIF